MSDRLGILDLPVPTPVVHPPDEQTLAPGDPALVLLGGYVATALQADLGAAWEALSPGKPDLTDAVDGTRDGTGPVRRVFFSDPRKGYFNDADLPALFVYRAQHLAYRRAAQDAHRRSTTIGIAWVPPRADEDPQRRERDPFVAAVSAALHKALIERRHPAWVAPADEADPDALKTSFATSTSAVTISSFNGAQAGQTMVAARPVTITTAPAVGAYETTVPIVVTGVVESGESFSWSVFLTDPDGGETISTVFDFATTTSVALPEMLTTGGSIQIGYGASPDARKGSPVQRACSFVEWRPGKPAATPIAVKRPGVEPIAFEVFEIPLDVAEDHFFDPDQRGFDPYDIQAFGHRGDLGEEVFEIFIEG